MSTTSDNKYTGGLSFNAGVFSMGGMNAGAGLQFDLPLATVAGFNQQALDFTSTGASNRFGFMQNVIDSTQKGVTSSDIGSSNIYTQVINAIRGVNDQTSMYLNEINNRGLQTASNSGGGGGWCFITTAVCDFEGLADDCDTLQILRGFRDGYMTQNDDTKNLVKQYYSEAPAIVEAIAKRDDKEIIYRQMRDTFINPCVTLITAGHYNAAFILYVALFDFAKKAGA